MLIGVFELLALKQDEFDAYEGYINALRDYWQARAKLALAVGTQLPSGINAQLKPLQLDPLVGPTLKDQDQHHHHLHTGDEQ